jgi:hypothetical protein
MRRAGAKVALYTNDDPFGPDRDLRIWKRFRKVVPYADVCFAYRTINVQEYLDAGAKRVGILRSGYSPSLLDYPSLNDADRLRFGCDVVFAGHCEDDERLDQIDDLLQTPLTVRIFGTEWARFAQRRRWQRLLPILRIQGADYAHAIQSARIALVFLSRRNRDQYTRRCFEIPALGTLMLAPRTEELSAMYKEDEEAVFFSSKAELIEKAIRYTRDEATRARIAAAGRTRCLSSAYDTYSRAREFLKDLEGR